METRYSARCACKTKTVHLHYEIQGGGEINKQMEDLAHTVMNQLQMNDGSSSNLLLATWSDRGSRHTREHILVLPITKNGTTSYNVQVARWTILDGVVVENDDLDQWHADKLFNVATSAQAADFLMFNAKARHKAPDGDYPYLMLTVGLFGKNLFNQTPMKFKSQEAVKELIDMLGSMRPTVEA